MQPARREILIFELGGRRFGLHAGQVRELVRAASTVPLPLAPAVVEGVLNLRGRIVPVLDVRAQLGLPAKGAEPSDHLIITSSRGNLVALRVDRAVDLVALHEADLGEDGEGRAACVAKLADGIAPILGEDLLLSQSDSAALRALLPEEAG